MSLDLVPLRLEILDPRLISMPSERVLLRLEVLQKRHIYTFSKSSAVTLENFSSKVCTRDYVGDGNYSANFSENRFSEGFSPNR